jgi:hypothetical protein
MVSGGSGHFYFNLKALHLEFFVVYGAAGGRLDGMLMDYESSCLLCLSLDLLGDEERVLDFKLLILRVANEGDFCNYTLKLGPLMKCLFVLIGDDSVIDSVNEKG